MKLLVQGWRFIHHSYALVAQAHSVCLLRRGDVELRFQDLPFLTPEWQPSRGILDADDERALAELRGPDGSFAPEASAAAATGGIVLIDGNALIDLTIETTLKDERKSGFTGRITKRFVRGKKAS